MKGVVGVLLALALGACQSKQEQQKMMADAYAQGEAKAKADAEAAARAKAERLAKERANFLANPSQFLTASADGTEGAGFLWADTNLASVTVFNKSRFPAANISGMTDWLNGSGGLVSSTPFSLSGSVPPGQSETFTTAAGTLRSNRSSGRAAQVRLKVTSVTTIDLPVPEPIIAR
jgi:hypothetical protein